MPQPTQATRHIAIDTPLGEDVLLLRSFSAHEEISRLFEFDLDLLSENYEINFDDIIAQNVTLRMELPGGGKRYWNGYINRFVQGVSTSPQFARYRATMVPWLWFLTRTSDCRIFQEKTVPDIIKQIFRDLGFSDIEDRLSGGYRTWNYCVQYRETDFNFVSRLMEQEGIYYYFLHEQGKCTIVLCDSLSKHDPYGDYDEIDFTPDTKSSTLQERISEWTIEKRVRTGKFAHIDYNFEKPSTSLMSTEEDKKSHARADYEIYDYPGEYLEKEDGERYAKVRMEELAKSHEICRGRSDSRGICSGYRFTMVKHTRRDQNREYLVVSTDYQAAAEDYETSGGLDEMCACSFTAIPNSLQFRPERTTPKPIIQGNQTAVVTGPSGEEIYTDEHGRVKVQFHWDREGKRDENSSCWIRVSQVHAGKSFGGMDIPRIGEEVVVSFLEGDPDRPIITGRVYNAEVMPPFGLPGQKVVSGMKSNSTPGGGGYNEISLNDTKGKEGLTIHAQYDMNTTVQHDQTNTVKNDFTETITNNANIKITDGNYSHDVMTGTANYHVQSALTEKYDATQQTTVKGDLTIKSTTGKIEVSADASHVKVDAATKITLHTGASTIEMDAGGNIKIDAVNITINGSVSVTTTGKMVTSEATAQHQTKGAIVISEGSATNTVKGGTVLLNP
jgi:type VI secretion system secreted protein VgrG